MRRVTPHNDAIIDVPHTPEAESELMQEVKERLSHLETHTANPEAVASLQQLNEDLHAVMANVSTTEEYGCRGIRVMDDTELPLSEALANLDLLTAAIRDVVENDRDPKELIGICSDCESFLNRKRTQELWGNLDGGPTCAYCGKGITDSEERVMRDDGRPCHQNCRPTP